MTEKLVFGQYYHIYNRGNNSETLFFDESDYEHFIYLYKTFVLSVAETIAWALMKNHFHLLVKIKEKVDIGFLNPAKSKRNNLEEKWKVYFGDDVKSEIFIQPEPTSQFRNLLSTYAKYVNKKQSRTGSLFETPFERKLVSDEDYLRRLLMYINNNPVKHKVVSDSAEYKWSSFYEISKNEFIISDKQFYVDRFGSIENFTKLFRDNDDQDEFEFRDEDDCK